MLEKKASSQTLLHNALSARVILVRDAADLGSTSTCCVRVIDNHDFSRESVEIPSVSGWATHRQECIRQMHHTKALLEAFGATTRFVDIGMQQMRDGSEIPLPPIVLGELGNDPKKKTLLGFVRNLDVFYFRR